MGFCRLNAAALLKTVWRIFKLSKVEGGLTVEKRKAVEKVTERMYRHFEKTSGRLPDGKELRRMEEKVKKAALTADNIKERA